MACEPLAPEQSPRYVVVTGETPDAGNPFLVTPQVGGIVPTGEMTPVSAPLPTTIGGAGGVVNTPVPSATPIPPSTALPSPTPFACSERAGRALEATFFSAVIGEEVAYLIYLPPCFYETLQRYPYVILLHGTGYDHTMWEELGASEIMDQGVTKGSLPPMVLVMPDGNLISELNDQSDGQSYETVILDELIPAVEADFCLWGSRQGRALGGISRGGFWAFSIALRHPEMFSALGGHSPHFEVDNAAPESNPLDLAGSVNLDKFPLRIYMDNGADDVVGENVIRMSDLLRENGVEHTYLINPTGDHSMDYWVAHAPEYLAFYGQVWPHDPLALPSCLEPSPPS